MTRRVGSRWLSVGGREGEGCVTCEDKTSARSD